MEILLLGRISRKCDKRGEQSRNGRITIFEKLSVYVLFSLF